MLEAPEILVDTGFKKSEESRQACICRTGETLFQEYDSKVDEVSYDSCTIACSFIF